MRCITSQRKPQSYSNRIEVDYKRQTYISSHFVFKVTQLNPFFKDKTDHCSDTLVSRIGILCELILEGINRTWWNGILKKISNLHFQCKFVFSILFFIVEGNLVFYVCI